MIDFGIGCGDAWEWVGNVKQRLGYRDGDFDYDDKDNVEERDDYFDQNDAYFGGNNRHSVVPTHPSAIDGESLGHSHHLGLVFSHDVTQSRQVFLKLFSHKRWHLHSQLQNKSIEKENIWR
jgi:hypothetical protein